MFLRKYELTIDIALLKQNFPHLIRFSDRLMRDLYVFRGIAPVEISIPKEFLFTDPPRIKPCCIGAPKIDTLVSTFEGVSLEDTGERRQRAEGRGQKDRLAGDSDSPLNVDHQNKVFGGGFKPKKVEGERTAEPSAICPSSAASSAFQGGSLGDLIAVANRASGSYLTTTELFMCPRCSLIHNARQRPPLGIDYPGQLELVQEATRAFKQTGYSYYDQYYFYRERLGVRSLFELYEYDLKKLLLLLN